MDSMAIRSWVSVLVLVLVALLLAVANGVVKPANKHYGDATLQGWRQYQEDRVMAFPMVNGTFKVGLFGIFDGHGGKEASEYLHKNFYSEFVRKLPTDFNMDPETFVNALESTIRTIETNFMREAKRKGWTAGSTACVVVATDKFVVVANVGDSKAVACVPSEDNDVSLDAVELTIDHHPDLPKERSRIEAAGGTVLKIGPIYRVNGMLAMSRAIGDKNFKPYGVIAEPEITSWMPSQGGVNYLVVASDGIFEGMAPQDVCNVVSNEVARGYSKLEHLAIEVVERAFSNGSTDNLSAIVLKR